MAQIKVWKRYIILSNDHRDDHEIMIAPEIVEFGDEPIEQVTMSCDQAVLFKEGEVVMFDERFNDEDAMPFGPDGHGMFMFHAGSPDPVADGRRLGGAARWEHVSTERVGDELVIRLRRTRRANSVQPASVAVADA